MKLTTVCACGHRDVSIALGRDGETYEVAGTCLRCVERQEREASAQQWLSLGGES